MFTEGENSYCISGMYTNYLIILKVITKGVAF